MSQHQKEQHHHHHHHHHGHANAAPLIDEPAPVRTIPDRSVCVYTSCYCEENVWQLCKYLSAPDEDGNIPLQALEPYYAVFISNPNKTVLLFEQKAGHPPDGRCLWDYHVILVGKLLGPGKKSLVWDLDTKLDFPTPIDAYFERAIKPDNSMPALYRRNFRVIPASVFYNEFASDRRHMKNPDGTWMSPPPKYDPICGSRCMVEHNLESFINMAPPKDGQPEFGVVLQDAYQFLTFFSRSC